MDDFVAKCVECGSEDMYRIITGGTGFVLKGSGWSGRDLKEKNQREKRAEKMQKKMEDNSGNHKRRQRTKEEFGL
jgi:predicted nucleic acid-binding Zn ribbon protein